MSIRSIPLNWEVGHHTEPDERPEKFVPATVPGAVQLDWAAAEGWEPWWHGDNWKQYRWMEDCFWTYRARIVDTAGAGQRVFLVLEGVDYAFDVLLNGSIIVSQEGMFTPVRVELTGRAKAGDELLIRIHPTPKSCTTPENRDQANRCCKPAVSYEWDFHPRLIPLGIWQNACIQITPQTYIRDCEVRYTLSDDLGSANVSIAIDVDGPAADATYRLTAPNGQVAMEGEWRLAGGRQTVMRELKQPQLWWPHDHGTPIRIYTSSRCGDRVGGERRAAPGFSGESSPGIAFCTNSRICSEL